jgi:hypothetical protein
VYPVLLPAVSVVGAFVGSICSLELRGLARSFNEICTSEESRNAGTLPMGREWLNDHLPSLSLLGGEAWSFYISQPGPGVQIAALPPDVRKGSAFPEASLSHFGSTEGCAFLRPLPNNLHAQRLAPATSAARLTAGSLPRAPAAQPWRGSGNVIHLLHA